MCITLMCTICILWCWRSLCISNVWFFSMRYVLFWRYYIRYVLLWCVEYVFYSVDAPYAYQACDFYLYDFEMHKCVYFWFLTLIGCWNALSRARGCFILIRKMCIRWFLFWFVQTVLDSVFFGFVQTVLHSVIFN